MKKLRILIVDDMKEVYHRIKNKLNVDYSNNEEDAINKINSNHYDLVISDYHLGDKSPKGGLNVIKAAKTKGIESILISRDNHEKEALKVGADRFMFKKEFIEEYGEKYKTR